MTGPSKTLLFLGVTVVALGGGAVFGLRAGRNKIGTPGEIKPGLAVVTNAGGIGVFAARVAPGPHVILFDTGLDPQGRPVDALLSALQAGRDDVTDVFLTHGHFDHISGVNVVPKARVHLGAADIPMATGQAKPAAFVPMLLGLAMKTPPIAVNAPLTGTAILPVGAPDASGTPKAVKAIPVPGHTPGSYAYFYDGVLIAGDIMIFKDGRLELTPWIFDPDPDANKAAIRSLKTALMGETVDIVCTSHGGCTPKGLGRNLLDDLISRIGG